MNKNNKQNNSILPGHAIGAKVVKTKRNPKGDITYALQIWKKTLKESGNLQKLKDKKEFVKQSVIRRKQLNRAKYLAKLQDYE